MEPAFKNISDKFAFLDKLHGLNKLSLLMAVGLFAAIPVTVFGVVTLRQIDPQAATGKPDKLTPTGYTSNDRPTFSWSCYCYTTRYRVYLRQDTNQFWSNNYWYKDVSSTSADYAGWKSSGSYPTFPGFSSGTYHWTVGCTPGYGSCYNADVVSFKLDTIPPTAPTSITSSANSFGSVTLNWTASKDNNNSVGYTVYRSQKLPLGSGSPNTWVCQSFQLTCVDTRFEGGLFTYYYVLAYDVVSNTSAFSPALVMYTPDNDLDKDTFNDTLERWMTTDVRYNCGGPNAWPPDFDGNGKVNQIDQNTLAANFNTTNVRYDFNKDSKVNALDLYIHSKYLGKTC